ncbi:MULTISPECIES: GNAT family acetyltransferase [Pseudomonas]|jgi:ribosomal protein S18 acetylase RimI-like enzyme|uniref:Acetyltransferase YpeA n=1 Tax=Pseudomonas fluorescens TaxID=294 RepID=A0A5E7QPT5_PSEFL|nr:MULTISPECIES: GNAT family acetyltransferase [Pseudomonas]VVM12881.1 Acetyltransferase YpeA [Pseudomonas fluorescens]AVJ39029.1 GNAT family acetyltransferase [Pseudomonas lurida]MBC3926525.1 GNAT family acetyltransferase [Pseudomonas lurida]PRA12440.1 GNAT family acetyltransferase [Pseudomonas sp. MYb13]PRA17557.1 GNAT family acetyltransferase [Pseudomonas lurida]
MSTAVRTAQTADAEGISQVILAALHSSNARDYPPDVIARVAANFTPDAVLALLQRRVVLVAVQERVIVATAALDANVVRSVFVNPALQGQGIGRLLMIEIELRAREAGVTVLSVPSSLTAEPFYTKLGFHTVRDVYHGNERTLVMEKALLSRHPIGPYRDRQHRAQVVALWQEAFGYDTAHNLPTLVIDKKLAVNDGLFFVATDKKTVVGTILAGYDGHRGWLYSVAVHADYRRHGLGSSLVRHAEQALTALGCMKVNLQITSGNDGVAGFYEALGYGVEPRISMGKKIVGNIPTQS